MARLGRIGLPILLAAVLLTVGCLGLTDGDAELETAAPTTDGSQAVNGPMEDDGDAPQEERATLTLRVKLTGDSSPPLTIRDVSLEPALSADVDSSQPTVRAVASETVTAARWSTLGELDLSAGRLNVTAFDGLGQITIPLEVQAGTVEKETTVTVELTTNGPGEVDIVDVNGSTLIQPAASQAEPSYGYLLWPDGSRERLPGFDYAVHVPAEYPNIPPGQQAGFLVEAPDSEEVLWRFEDRSPEHGSEFTFTTEPGRQHVRLSVGPGESSTSLGVHSDRVIEENGTVVAGTPEGPAVEPANVQRVPFNVTEGAFHVTAVLTPIEPDHQLEDLDLFLVDEHGDTLASSETENETLEVVSWDTPRPGSYELRIESDEGVAQDYQLRLRINY